MGTTLATKQDLEILAKDVNNRIALLEPQFKADFVRLHAHRRLLQVWLGDGKGRRNVATELAPGRRELESLGLQVVTLGSSSNKGVRPLLRPLLSEPGLEARDGVRG